MNVFVLCTGRCGSMTFAAACKHITNYTSAHERQRQHQPIGKRYLSLWYPDNHIEVDNRLSWFLGGLEKEYGAEAFYVHLIRDREEVARSFLKRWDQRGANIIFSFAWGILTTPYGQVTGLSDHERIVIARQYWDTVNDNIRFFLRDKPRKTTMWLSDMKGPFQEFWHRIGAEGDLSAALEVWKTRLNASVNEEEERPAQQPLGPQRESFHRHGRGVTAGCLSPSLPGVRQRLVRHDALADETVKAVAVTEQAISRALQLCDRVVLNTFQPPPEPKSWMLSAETLRFLVSLIEHIAPRHIVEFGSGLSTRIMLETTQHLHPACTVTSVEHDPDYAEETLRAILPALKARLSLQLAPLVLRKLGETFVPTYHLDLSVLPSLPPIDLCLIDGPPNELGGREGTLYQILDHCRPGTCVLLDDADRDRETEALQRWSATLGNAIEVRRLEGFEKGLALVIVTQRVSPSRLWEHKLKAAADELDQVIPEGARVLIIDDYQWPDDVADLVKFRIARERSFPPADSSEGIRKIEEHMAHGIDFLVVAWPAFWWLNHYLEFTQYLRRFATCPLSNGRVVVYSLRGATPKGDAALNVTSKRALEAKGGEHDSTSSS
jgi:predicted O-methyltransferase YrrM